MANDFLPPGVSDRMIDANAGADCSCNDDEFFPETEDEVERHEGLYCPHNENRYNEQDAADDAADFAYDNRE